MLGFIFLINIICEYFKMKTLRCSVAEKSSCRVSPAAEVSDCDQANYGILDPYSCISYCASDLSTAILSSTWTIIKWVLSPEITSVFREPFS